METCGEYELERAIGWGRDATFFSARTSGARGPALIVVRRARSDKRKVGQDFLRAAAEQQAAVGAGCRRLAPILGFGFNESGFAYSATAFYDTSLADFLEAGCRVDGPLLREVVTGVLAALAELHDKSRRPHGNLRPGNILFDRNRRIVLTDLAPSAKDKTTADDLYDLGTLLYQLVHHTARTPELLPPLDYSPNWTDALGDDAVRWLEYTNRRLAKERNTAPDAIQIAHRELESLASIVIAKPPASPKTRDTVGTGAIVRPPLPKERNLLPKIAALLLFLGVSGGGAFLFSKKQNPGKGTTPTPTPPPVPHRIVQFMEDLSKLVPAESFPNAKDQNLRAALGHLRALPIPSVTANEVKVKLGNWGEPAKMKNMSAAWKIAPRGWKLLATHLETAAEITLEEDEAQPAILDQLKNASATRDAADELNREWEGITFLLKELNASGNRLMPDFSPWIIDRIGGVRRLTDAVKRAKEAAKTLDEVREFQRISWARVVQKKFEKEKADILKTPGGIAPDEWKQAAARYLGPTAEENDKWKRILEDANVRIGKLPTKDRARWQQELAEKRKITEQALEEEGPAINEQLLVFKGLRLPVEEAHEQYTVFLKQWSAEARIANTAENARAVITKFEAETGKLLAESQEDERRKEYVTALNAFALAREMREALKTPDQITLRFSDPSKWTLLPIRDPKHTDVVYYKFAGSDFNVPFIALPNNGSAMAAIETPIELARLSGVRGSPPGEGPKIRTADFKAETNWLWKGPTNAIVAGYSGTYFARGAGPGDFGSRFCPVSWLTFEEAKEMARALGGQLPTSEQWTLASKHKEQSPIRRLRASAWTDQLKDVNSYRLLDPPGHAARLPDWGSYSYFLSADANAKGTEKDAAAKGATDDRQLWLRSVFPRPPAEWKPEDGFYHLIGNAAEWVVAGGGPGIIGGSVVSPPTTDSTTTLVPRPGTRAFDLTFRLLVPLGEGMGEGAGLKAFKAKAEKVTAPEAPAMK